LLGAVPDGEVGGARVWVATGDDELAAVFEGRTTSRVAIEEPASGRVLAEATFSTCPLSLHRNRNRAAWKKRELFLRALRHLHRPVRRRARTSPPRVLRGVPSLARSRGDLALRAHGRRPDAAARRARARLPPLLPVRLRAGRSDLHDPGDRARPDDRALSGRP